MGDAMAALDRAETAQAARALPLDLLVADLQRLRNESGQTSFGDIAVRIAHRREAAGMSPAAARVPRSSVHAMFLPGRRRMNPQLLEEIVLALGKDEATAEAWRLRLLTALEPAPKGLGLGSSETQPSKHPGEPDGVTGENGENYRPQSAVKRAPLPAPRSSASIPRPFTRLPTLGHRAFPPLVTVLLLAACVGFNHWGGTLNAKFELPLFLDMVGTAVAAIALGPWYGALVGLTSNTLGALAANPVSLAFALVNIAGALVWGYGVRAWRMQKPWWRFLLLNLFVALACTMVAVPINVLFGGVAEGHAAGGLVAVLVASGQGIWAAVFSVNIAASVADKLISGYVALGLTTLLLRWSRVPNRDVGDRI